MNYELAKKLKDAGFPQDYKNCSSFYDDTEAHELWTIGNCTEFTESVGNPYGNGFDTPNTAGCDSCSVSIGSNAGDCVIRPTLSQLIEACGDDFSVLSKVDDGWYCESYPKIHDTQDKTPEEAVANLWLELNKKI